MSTSSVTGSLITDRTISTKVGVGFACVLALLAIVSTTSYLSFQTSATGFSTYAQRVSVVGTAREIERSFLNLRRYVREFALLGGESNVMAANKEQAMLQPLFQQGLAEIKNPERHRQLDEAAAISRSIGRISANWWRKVANKGSSSAGQWTPLAPVCCSISRL